MSFVHFFASVTNTTELPNVGAQDRALESPGPNPPPLVTVRGDRQTQKSARHGRRERYRQSMVLSLYSPRVPSGFCRGFEDLAPATCRVRLNYSGVAHDV